MSAKQEQRDSISLGDRCFLLSGLVMTGLVMVNDWPLVINFLLHGAG
ncbi:hypothetical protein [Shewanella sp. c952]|nr:hypothetical protein [Shewanella sp. c952]